MRGEFKGGMLRRGLTSHNYYQTGCRSLLLAQSLLHRGAFRQDSPALNYMIPYTPRSLSSPMTVMRPSTPRDKSPLPQPEA